MTPEEDESKIARTDGPRWMCEDENRKKTEEDSDRVTDSLILLLFVRRYGLCYVGWRVFSMAFFRELRLVAYAEVAVNQ